MSISYTWRISDLERETATGKVNTVHYTISATDGIYNSSAYGSVDLHGDITIPYGDLTEEICIDWMQNALAASLPEEDADNNPIPLDTRRADAINQIESTLANQINEQAAPTHANGTPW